MGLQGIITAWKWFQNLLHSKLLKMAEKPKFMVLGFYFYLKFISNKVDIWQGKTLPGVLLEERKLNISK